MLSAKKRHFLLAPLVGVWNGYYYFPMVLFSSLFVEWYVIAQSKLLGGAFNYYISCLQLQAVYLMLDDIMDNSQTRRGQPCWFRVPQVR